MREQISNGHREIVVRVHQSCNGSDDPVPVGVRIVGKRYLVLIFQSDEPCHRIWTGTIHADLPVVIHCHERKCWVNGWIHDDDVEPVNGIDRLPIRTSGAAQRVHANFEASAANCIHVNDVFEIAHVWQDEVFLVRRRGLERFGKRNSLDPNISCSQQFVRPVLDPARDVSIGWAAVGRVVLEASILGRVVGWCNDDAVSQVLLATAVGNQDGSRDYGGWSYAVVLLDDCLYVVRRQHFEGGTLRGRRQSVGIFSHVQGAAGSLRSPVVANCLGNS